MFQWYDTDNGHVLINPGQGDCATTGGTFDNCSFVSNVDNGLYASGLVVARQALPGVRALATKLSKRMDFSLFYDNRAETHCNVNRDIAGNQPTGQMYGGYYKGSPPDVGDNSSHYYHNGALYSDPRISAYLGMGRHEMPGNVWWRSWRELPPPAPFKDCQDDPDFSWQGQWPMDGSWQTVTDPQSGKKFPVWEGAYKYPGTNLKYIPPYSGGMFEALMVNQVVPETSWGTHSFGLADHRIVTVQRRYAKKLGYPVWGMSPSSTADDSGGYAGYGVAGKAFPYHGQGATASDPNQRLAQCSDCADETVVTPHASFIALDPAPQAAYANIMRLKREFPGVYGPQGFYDALNPTTGRSRPPDPGARPVDDHGVDRQRPEQSGAAATLRGRQGLGGSEALPRDGAHEPLRRQPQRSGTPGAETHNAHVAQRVQRTAEGLGIRDSLPAVRGGPRGSSI